MMLRLSLNGEAREFPSPLTVEGLLRQLALDPRKVAVERNLEIVPRSTYEQVGLSEGDLVELEVLGDRKTLYPDMIETLRATEVLIREGFQVMVYCTDDPLLAKRLEEMGVAAIMPLAAPIGSGLGIRNPINIRLIVEEAKVPVIV